jgi:hypothetical protein
MYSYQTAEWITFKQAVDLGACVRKGEHGTPVFFVSALERTRDRVPLDWAMTQNNLGIALETLGKRESGTARLEEAVSAYRDALLERTRDRVPLDWAMTQNNLEMVLRLLVEER